MKAITTIVNATRFKLKVPETSYSDIFFKFWNNLQVCDGILKVDSLKKLNQITVTVLSSAKDVFQILIDDMNKANYYLDLITILSTESIKFCKIDLESENLDDMELFTEFDADNLEFALNTENF